MHHYYLLIFKGPFGILFSQAEMKIFLVEQGADTTVVNSGNEQKL